MNYIISIDLMDLPWLFFDILLTVHLNIFILILANWMH